MQEIKHPNTGKLTSDLQDVCENVIGNLLSVLNGCNPLLDAIPADCPDGSHCLSVTSYFVWVHILKGEN